MGNTLRLSFHKDPLTLDPQKSGDKLSSAIIFLLFKGLTRLGPDQTIHCDLADFFYALDNHRKFVFRLGEHFWSDKTPITAHDFVYSWKRALSPKFPAPAVNFFSYIKNAEKIKKGLLSPDKIGVYAESDHVLVVELEHPCPYFLELTSFCPLFPVSSRSNENEIFSICSGAFQLQSWDKGKEILLQKNLQCKIPAQIGAIHIKIIPDEREAFTLYENDQLDWIGDPISPLPLAYLPSLYLNKQVQPIAGIVGCWFNTLKRPFCNVNLRKAFAYAIPRRKLLEKLLLPDSLLANGIYPSLLQNDEVYFSEENQEKACEFFNIALHELKIKRPIITLTFESTDRFLRIAALLKTYWEAVFNIRIKCEPVPFKELLHRMPSQQFQVSLLHAISQYTDVINFLERFESRSLPRNFSGWENSKYQEILKTYRKTINNQERQALAKKAELMLLQEMPVAPIYCDHYAYLQKPYVQNFSISPIGVAQFDRVILQQKQSEVFFREKSYSTNVG